VDCEDYSKGKSNIIYFKSVKLISGLRRLF